MAPKKIAQTVLTEGKFYTISAANGKVIEVADYNIDNGAKIQLMDNANFEWQQWNFVAAGDGVYRIQNRFTGKMMDLDMGGVSDGTRVHQWEGAQASSQLWVVEPTNDGRVKIKSNLAGKLLDPGMATENGTVLQIWADVNGDNQFWTINEVTRNRNIAKTPYIQSHQTPQHQKNRNFTTQPAPPKKNRNKSQKTKAARLKPSSMPQSQ